MMARTGSILCLGAMLLAGCVPKPAPAPEPAPPPVAAPAPRPLPPPPQPAPVEWADLPLTPGEWLYSGEGAGLVARFAGSDGSGFLIRCERPDGRMLLAREGAVPAGGMTIRTTSVSRAFPAATASLAAGDPLLDAIAFSRGRFAVEVAGRMMILPAWPEPGRVAEDCRS
jgi:hypothetical protein